MGRLRAYLRGIHPLLWVTASVAVVVAGGVLHRTQRRVADEALTGVQAADFAEAQSFIADFDGSPLLAADWSGRFRPYLFRNGAYEPLLPSELDDAYAQTDFYSPTPVTATLVVLAGHRSGEPGFGLYAYDTETQTLLPLTDSAELDERRFCVERSAGLLSFRSRENVQRFARVGRDGATAAGEPVAPGFERCVFTSAHQLIGVERRSDPRGRAARQDERDPHDTAASPRQAPYRAWVCRLTEGRVACRRSPALADVEELDDFFVTADRRVGVIARARNAPFAGRTSSRWRAWSRPRTATSRRATSSTTTARTPASVSTADTGRRSRRARTDR